MYFQDFWSSDSYKGVLSGKEKQLIQKVNLSGRDKGRTKKSITNHHTLVEE